MEKEGFVEELIKKIKVLKKKCEFLKKLKYFFTLTPPKTIPSANAR